MKFHSIFFLLIVLASCVNLNDSLEVVDGLKLGTSVSDINRQSDSINLKKTYLITNFDQKLIYDIGYPMDIWYEKMYFLSNAVNFDYGKIVGVYEVFGDKNYITSIELLIGNTTKLKENLLYFDNSVNIGSLDKIKAELEKKYGKAKNLNSFKIPFIYNNEYKNVLNFKEGEWIKYLKDETRKNETILPIGYEWSTKKMNIYLCYGIKSYYTVYTKGGDFINFQMLSSVDTSGLEYTFRYSYLRYEIKEEAKVKKF
jgi:hypothetical protein